MEGSTLKEVLLHSGRMVPERALEIVRIVAEALDFGWTNVSDRNQKHDFREIDPETVVAKLEGMPVSTWRYNSEESQALHMGPTAQDFYVV